jgi:Tol biopolymer transport system component
MVSHISSYRLKAWLSRLKTTWAIRLGFKSKAVGKSSAGYQFMSLLLSIVCIALLTGCTGNPGLLNIPFDPAGYSLNSLAADIRPEIAGQYIAFVSERQQRQNVYLYDFNTRRLIDLPGLNALDSIASDPDVSADGRYVVFAASRQGKSGIYFYDRDTRQLRNLTTNLPAEVRHPTLSADGNTIAFESSANGQWDILVYDRSGQPLDVPIDPR